MVTGRALQFPILHGSGRLLSILVDAEIAQIQGFGDINQCYGSFVSASHTLEPGARVPHERFHRHYSPVDVY